MKPYVFEEDEEEAIFSAENIQADTDDTNINQLNEDFDADMLIDDMKCEFVCV